jgi:hypothetical protein
MNNPRILARKQRKAYRKTESKKVNKKVISVVLFAFIFILISFIVLLSTSSSWDGNSRLSMAVLDESGEVNVLVLDPASNKFTTITIPGNTLVEAANQLGEWPLKSVQDLAKNEKRANDFVSHTITKTFAFPVDGWGNESLLLLFSQNPLNKLRALVTSYPTTLTFADKLRVISRSLRLRSADNYHIDLVDTSYLSDTVLLDGSKGYVVTGIIPPRLAVLFSDESVSLEQARIAIYDKTTNVGLAKAMSRVIEVIGAKVYSVQDMPSEDSDCEVRGTKVMTVTKIAAVFGCKANLTSTEGGFDVVLSFGEQFAKRY